MVYEERMYQSRQQNKYLEDCREIQKAGARATAIENVRINALIQKQQIREQTAERKKAIYEEVIIAPSGELQLQTRNLSVDAKPMVISNMVEPVLTILKRLNDVSEQIYMINCTVGKRNIDVFIEFNNAGNPSYLLRKLRSVGIVFYLPEPKAKRLVIGLIGHLLEESEAETLLPDEEGWMKLPAKKFIFVDEGGLTWKAALKMCK